MPKSGADATETTEETRPRKSLQFAPADGSQRGATAAFVSDIMRSGNAPRPLQQPRQA
jgi:hypothetical protein